MAFQGQKYQSTTDRTSLLTPLYVLDSCSIALDDMISLLASFPIWKDWALKVQEPISNLLHLFQKEKCIPSKELRDFLDPQIDASLSKTLNDVIPRSGQCFHLPNGFANGCSFAHHMDLRYSSASKPFAMFWWMTMLLMMY